MPFARQFREDSHGLGFNEPWNLTAPYKYWAHYSLIDRLQYTRLLYTCLYDASQTGETCFDPLFFHYPNDTLAMNDPEHSFMFANQIKVSPVMEEGVCNTENRTFKSYFPSPGYDIDGEAITGRWVNLDNYADVVSSNGSWVDLDAPCGHGMYPNANINTTIKKHLKPGGLITWTNNQNQEFKTTKDLITAPFNLIINPDNQASASGKAYLDRSDNSRH